MEIARNLSKSIERDVSGSVSKIREGGWGAVLVAAVSGLLIVRVVLEPDHGLGNDDPLG